jgi:hypothetical protein
MTFRGTDGTPERRDGCREGFGVRIASLIGSDSTRRVTAFAVVGALTGAVAAACTFYQIGEFYGVAIGGYCLGLQATPNSACGGIDGAIYIFPGLVFGIVFGPLLCFCRRLTAIGAVIYALAAFLANIAAVSVCVSAIHPLDDLLPFDNLNLETAIAGVIAGAVGGGLLGTALRAFDPLARRALSIAVAAGLGVLTPSVILFDKFGVFAFFILWQSGYAAAVAVSRPRSPRPAPP